MTRGRAKGRISVRRMQMKLLEDGNATMGVWLGKQLLGQTDQVQHMIENGPGVLVIMPTLPPPEEGSIDWVAPAIDVTPDSAGLIEREHPE